MKENLFRDPDIAIENDNELKEGKEISGVVTESELLKKYLMSGDEKLIENALKRLDENNQKILLLKDEKINLLEKENVELKSENNRLKGYVDTFNKIKNLANSIDETHSDTKEIILDEKAYEELRTSHIGEIFDSPYHHYVIGGIPEETSKKAHEFMTDDKYVLIKTKNFGKGFFIDRKYII